jgi:hypothetical protein
VRRLFEVVRDGLVSACYPTNFTMDHPFVRPGDFGGSALGRDCDVSRPGDSEAGNSKSSDSVAIFDFDSYLASSGCARKDLEKQSEKESEGHGNEDDEDRVSRQICKTVWMA